MPPDTLLRVRGLTIGFPSGNGAWRHPVKDLSLTVDTNERVGLVGESGSGKSLTALACLGLIPEPGRLLGGEISITGVELFGPTAGAVNRVPHGSVGLVFQEAADALNPVYSVGFQLEETIRVQCRVARREARERAYNLLASVSLDNPPAVHAAYPYELSGGQAQRVMLALALAGEPKLLIADEPTSALDLVTQAQVLRLIERLTAERGLALLLISHDLGVVSGMVERVVVMHGGRIVEGGPAEAVLADPLHPFTRLLMASRSGRSAPPTDASTPYRSQPHAGGCSFADRCPDVRPPCRVMVPDLENAGNERTVRCPVVLEEMVSAGDC